MKLKKIISSALLAATVFAVGVAAFPIGASAAYSSVGSAVSSSTATAELDNEELEAYLKAYLGYNYSTAEEMLNDELAAGYLYTMNSANDLYSLFVNKYTGFVFYRNNLTGQILTSNPINPGYGGLIEGTRQELMSQIQVKFHSNTDTYTYTSYKWAALRSQISVTPITNGVRVSYTIGDTDTRFLLPGLMPTDSYENNIIKPIVDKYVEYLEEICGDKTDEPLGFYDNEKYVATDEYGFLNTSSSASKKGLNYYFKQTDALCQKYYSTNSKEYNNLYEIQKVAIMMVRAYTLKNPQKLSESSAEYDKYPILKEGVAIYAYTGNSVSANKRSLANIIKTYCPEYSFSQMYKDEAACGYESQINSEPYIRCSLEYIFNTDGSLSISLPASSISFDETLYTLDEITPLRFFGAADASRDGYIYYPDGSGTVIEFEDFYANSVNVDFGAGFDIYGIDYCYSKITGARRQQVTMPVFGVVSEVDANATTKLLYGKDTVTNGYFAIMEEGSSLAEFKFYLGGASNKFASAYTTYVPYPADEIDLSETISVGATGTYKMVAETKYTGSYVTRIVMLTDDEIGAEVYGENAFYASSYVGMAAYYRDYLKGNGTLSALELVSSDIPLYIEVLGAMDITTKVLTFPVTKTIALTSFDDVATMYKELSGCKDLVLERALENEKLAAKESDEELKASYEKLAAEYRELYSSIENISNINFRLTGFANGGMKSTYPVKLRWERACGGASGFEDLVSYAEKVSKEEGTNLGIYPDFDFLYINNTSMFDGIGNRGNVSRQVDNRYASKQVYSSISRSYESDNSLVISSDALDRLYSKFNKKYSSFGYDKLSVSTLGSGVNSNFDEDDPIDRETSISYITSLFARMTEDDGYELMVDTGNIYSVKYAAHILNSATDSSHLRYASYAVPFTGLVLHSYVNYTGTPLNYSGNVNYEILKSIENGAAPYYILCYRNSSYLKDDEDLNDYYGVAYENWYDDIVSTYAKINGAIGGLQDYELADHKTIVCERIIEDSEMEANYVLLLTEALEMLDSQLEAAIDAAFGELGGDSENYSLRVKLVVDTDAIFEELAERVRLSVSEMKAIKLDSGKRFGKALTDLADSYMREYAGISGFGRDAAEGDYLVSFSELEYTSKYSYVTSSSAFDKNYVRTDYTIDNGKVTMVTYRKGTDEVSFVLNYNNYPVTVRLDSNTEFVLEAYAYKEIR